MNGKSKMKCDVLCHCFGTPMNPLNDRINDYSSNEYPRCVVFSKLSFSRSIFNQIVIVLLCPSKKDQSLKDNLPFDKDETKATCGLDQYIKKSFDVTAEYIDQPTKRRF